MYILRSVSNYYSHEFWNFVNFLCACINFIVDVSITYKKRPLLRQELYLSHFCLSIQFNCIFTVYIYQVVDYLLQIYFDV